MNVVNRFLLYFLLVTASLFMCSCENDGTETVDPGFTISFSGFSDSQAMWKDLLLPRAFAAVTSVKMCIHQIRFKADNSADQPGENANIEVGFVELESEGTDLGNLSVAPGSYRRIDIMVKDDCGESFGLSVVNDGGTYELQSPKILRFEGDFEVESGSGDLVLNIPNFINFFDGVRSDSDLADGVESISGTF